MQLSDHFTLEEMTFSDTATACGIDNSLDLGNPEDIKVIKRLVYICETILEPVRKHYGKPITPNSGYRCKDLNAAVGGSPISQHMRGEAVDFEVDGIANIDLVHWLSENIKDFDQIILEGYAPYDPAAGWVHISGIKNPNRNECLTADARASVLGLPVA